MAARLWLNMDPQAIANPPIREMEKVHPPDAARLRWVHWRHWRGRISAIETESGNMYTPYNRIKGATYSDPWWEFGKAKRLSHVASSL